MPNIKSAKKRVKVTATKSAQNKMAKTALKTDLKKYFAVVKENPENLEAAVNEAYKNVDQACAAGLLHKNAAAHKKSQIAVAAAAAKNA